MNNSVGEGLTMLFASIKLPKIVTVPTSSVCNKFKHVLDNMHVVKPMQKFEDLDDMVSKSFVL